MRAEWADESMAISSVSQVDQIIRDVRDSGVPTLVYIYSDNNEVLAFGIGHDESVLTFAEPSGRTFHSLGSRYREGLVQFMNVDTMDDFMLSMAVPEAVAAEAARSFVSSARRPHNVTWESDW